MERNIDNQIPAISRKFGWNNFSEDFDELSRNMIPHLKISAKHCVMTRVSLKCTALPSPYTTEEWNTNLSYNEQYISVGTNHRYMILL